MDKEQFLGIITSDRGEDLANQVTENMVKYGGSFVKALADCYIKADYQNSIKLIDAFKDYFWKYRPEKWSSK